MISLTKCWRFGVHYRRISNLCNRPNICGCQSIHNEQTVSNYSNSVQCYSVLPGMRTNSTRWHKVPACLQIIAARQVRTRGICTVCAIRNQKIYPPGQNGRILNCGIVHSVLKNTEGFLINTQDYSSQANGISNELFEKYLHKLCQEYEDLKSNVAENKQESRQTMKPVIHLIKDFQQKMKDYQDLIALIAGLDPTDDEIRYMAEQEKREYRTHLEELKQQILVGIIPEERTDGKDIVLEVLQGVGGQEAMLFAAEIYDMYRGLADYKGWKFDVGECDKADSGGIRKASAIISGENVYKFFKFESGVHRVQRVPSTEKVGRIHTSTVIVAVLPQPTEIDVKINPKDLKIETTTATGKGGQHVNKTHSAVRITHLPTGIIVYCQDERSQIRNKETAMRSIRVKVYEHELKQQVLEYKAQRKLQVGSAARSEKIRTYNFNQDRITDHRLQENFFNMTAFLQGGEDIDILNEKLQETAREDIVQEILDTFENDLKQQPVK